MSCGLWGFCDDGSVAQFGGLKRVFGVCSCGSVLLHSLMYLVVNREEDWLVNFPDSFLGVLRPLNLPVEGKAVPFCVPRDRWDKEFFQIKGG